MLKQAENLVQVLGNRRRHTSACLPHRVVRQVSREETALGLRPERALRAAVPSCLSELFSQGAQYHLLYLRHDRTDDLMAAGLVGGGAELLEHRRLPPRSIDYEGHGETTATSIVHKDTWEPVSP